MAAKKAKSAKSKANAAHTPPKKKGRPEGAPKSPKAKRPTSRATQGPFAVSVEPSKKDRKAERIAQLRAEALARDVGQATERPPPPGPESTPDQRVAHCVDLMAGFHWLTPSAYETRCRLAEVWGVSESTIRNYAAEASRQLRASEEDREAGKILLAQHCEDVRQRAMTTFNEQTGMPDFGAELKAIEMIGRYQGHDEDKRKVELTGKDGGPIATITPTIFIPQEIEGE